MSKQNEIWILGAAGRVGRGVAANLAARQLSVVLVGRDRARLEALSRSTGGTARIVVAESLEATAAAIAQQRPSVVVNTIGPFASTALPIVRACPPGTHYVDVSNELFSIIDVLNLHDEARAAGKCLVAGAGYGFLGTEAVVLELCRDQPTPRRVRVDAIPFVAGGGDLIGTALAASIVDGLVAGGRRYEGGRLVRASAGGDAVELTLPDGRRVVTGSAPLGDLEAARRASGALMVVAGSSMVPTSLVSRLLLPLVTAILSWAPLRDFAVRRLALVRAPPARKESGSSWGHARVEWSDGTTREGWLRTGDGMTFTVGVMSEVAARLASNAGRRGAYTPGGLFGAELAVKAGGEITLNPRSPP